MGLSPFKPSFSSYDTPRAPGYPNPDPRVFRIEDHAQVKDHLVVLVRYPGCINYEGLKVLVYLDCTIQDLMKQGHIDPHFSDNPVMLSPFARFEPTEEGWTQAVLMLRNMQEP